MRYQNRILLLTLIAGLPGTALALALLRGSALPAGTAWFLAALTLGLWLGAALALHERIVRPLQTLSNLLAALREGDYSIRARGARGDDALGLALLEVNTLSRTLRRQRSGALEATALLSAVMAETDVVILAFDEDERLRLVNRAGEELLGAPAARLLGRTAGELGLGACLSGGAARTFTASFAGGTGRWELRRSSFRQGGLPHHLVVLTDLSRALREEERAAWQRLTRVLSHEINNSLAPIQSIAGSLLDLLRQEAPPEDASEDLEQGLGVIRGRAASLGRFLSSYARLTRLPAPRAGDVSVSAWAHRVAALEQRVPVEVTEGPEVTIRADADQLDQLLINLIRNAADASLETGGSVRVEWSGRGREVEVRILDEGAGLQDTGNLFVPFFTTKPQGSGIGLALSRQIAEAHGGMVSLENRRDRTGAVATLRLPL